jgi:hypothetical protein
MNRKKYGNKNSYSIPLLVSAFPGDTNNIKILITIRLPHKLIYSLYVQQYRLFKSDIPDYNSYIEYILNNKKQAEIFDYNYIEDLYFKEFGDSKARLIMFEELVSNKYSFLNKLSNVIRCDVREIVNSMSGKMLNKNKKKGNKSITNVQNPKKITALAGLF